MLRFKFIVLAHFFRFCEHSRQEVVSGCYPPAGLPLTQIVLMEMCAQSVDWAQYNVEDLPGDKIAPLLNIFVARLQVYRL